MNGNFTRQIETTRALLASADAVLIGAGAGLSVAAGFSYGGERFLHYFSDFHEKYGINDMYSGGFYSFDTLEEYWAWWSRHIWYNRYAVSVGKPYADLLRLVQGKKYFVLTTNVDHQFQFAGFEKARLFYTQGDYGLFQCSRPCHRRTYDNEAVVHEMVNAQRGMKIPASLVPRCPRCGAPMSVNLRCDDTFVEDAGWHAARDRYEKFLRENKRKRVVYLELGVGANTPVIIKYPFWRFTQENPAAVYVCVNRGESFAPREISARSVCIDADLGAVLAALDG